METQRSSQTKTLETVSSSNAIRAKQFPKEVDDAMALLRWMADVVETRDWRPFAAVGAILDRSELSANKRTRQTIANALNALSCATALLIEELPLNVDEIPSPLFRVVVMMIEETVRAGRRVPVEQISSGRAQEVIQ